MSIEGLLLILLLLALISALPAWPHSREWGYGPSSLVSVLLILLLIWLLVTRYPLALR